MKMRHLKPETLIYDIESLGLWQQRERENVFGFSEAYQKYVL
jgi:hypothetical protein